MTVPLRVALVADLLEERWPSMDLVADMLESHLIDADDTADLRVELLRPSLARFARSSAWTFARQMDRFANRFVDYPRWLRAQADRFDIFHVIDHSYAHLVHSLPAERTIVTCHDADAFLSLVDPAQTTSRLPRMVTRRILTGMQRAAAIACDSEATRDEMRRYKLAPERHMQVVRNGVHPAYLVRPDHKAEAAMDSLLGLRADRIDLLHVGSCIPRKRIDRLLEIFAAMRQIEPKVRLVKAGGALTPAQSDRARALGIEGHIVQLPFLPTPQLAALYRRASAVLIPSAREGFGLPVIEAMACGTPVIATELPVFREVGGAAIRVCPLDDTEAWVDEIGRVIALETDREAREMRGRELVAQSRHYSWGSYASQMAEMYRIAAHRASRGISEAA